MNNGVKYNKEYVLWLNDFTIKYPCFYDYGILAKTKSVSKLDQQNMGNLSSFYNVINEYATKNNIPPKFREFYRYHIIKYEDVLYEVGLAIFHEIIYFCNRLNEKDNSMIDLNYILIVNDEKSKVKKMLFSNKNINN